MKNIKGDTLNFTTRNTLAEIVTTDFKAVSILNKYDLDFCCNGKRTLIDACGLKNLDAETVVNELNMDLQPDNNTFHFNYWSAGFLADYIINNHHSYVKNMIPLIIKHAEKAAKAHGDAHPEFPRILKAFTVVSEELSAHMLKEERMLFPYIKKLEEGNINAAAPFGSILNPITVMEKEHEAAGYAMNEIRKLSSGYVPTEDMCETCRVLYNELKDFEQDLHVHVHLENNILFPMAIKNEEGSMKQRPASCSL